MPLMMVRCYAPRRHMASTNCNAFACATNVTPIIGVAHPSFISLLLCFVVLCQNCFKRIRARPPTQECREDYPPSHSMKHMSLYGGYHVSYDAKVLHTMKACGLYQL